MAEVLTDVRWEATARPTGINRIWANCISFARKKPLGALCGVIVLLFIVVGDQLITPTTRAAGDVRLRTSPTVYPTRFAGDAARPVPPTVACTGSSTTLTQRRSMSSHHVLATIPEWRGLRPVSRTA